MKCKDLDVLLSDYADNELTPEQNSVVETHLSECAVCRTTLAAYRLLGERISLLKAVPVGADTGEVTLENIRINGNVGKPVRWLRPALIGVPVMMVMILLAVLQPWTPTGGETTVMAMDKVVAETTAATGDLKSYRVTNTSIGGFFPAAQWEFIVNEYYHLQFDTSYTIKLPDGSRSSNHNEFIYIDGCLYSSETNSWITSLKPSTWLINNNEELTARQSVNILENLTYEKQLPDVTIDGVKCLHYLGNSRFDGSVVEVMIGKDDYLIRQLSRQYVVLGGYKTGTITKAVSTYTIKYFDFNEPVKVQAPLTASGDLLPGWRLDGGMAPLSASTSLPPLLPDFVGYPAGLSPYTEDTMDIIFPDDLPTVTVTTTYP